jgi:CHAD domain-containing protein
MLPPDLIDRLPGEAVRLIALDLVRESAAASARLGDGADVEALHDFRVGLRRLRSSLSAYKGELEGSISKKRRRQLREIAAATGSARDAEVQLAWLEGCASGLTPAQREACEWLARGLRARARREYAQVRGVVRQRFERLVGSTTEALATFTGRLDGGEATFATVAADHLQAAMSALDEALASVRSADDVESAHRARILAKRLRYLLEPLRGDAHADATPSVKTLKRLQELLGELHDAHVLADVLARALVRASTRNARQVHAAIYARRTAPARRPPARPRNLRPGLVALDRLNRDRRDALFTQLAREWLAPGERALRALVAALVAELRASATAGAARALPVRRFLLSQVPARALAQKPVTIETGYLPGARVREWLTRTSGPAGITYERWVEQGAGLRRTAIVEQPPHDLFDRLWPLTAGRRVVRRRYAVAEEDGSWNIDEVVGRRVVLASTQVEPDRELAAPAWVTPHLGAEVTGDPAYDDLALAGPARRRPGRARRRPRRR